MEYSYKNAGVNIELAQNTSEDISKIIDNNGFAGIVEHPMLKEYYLCSTTDGIGTKLIPLLEKADYKTIANDLIAMNLNDLACLGAFPVSFLDYIAVNKLDKDVVVKIIAELKIQLEQYNCQLVGGEIAELSSMIVSEKLDIAGFVTGMVSKSDLLGEHRVNKGDVVIAMSSSGAHANGYSLINKLLQEGALFNEDVFAPTFIYSNKIIELNKKGLIEACANITGGGILENISRVIPEGMCAELHKNSLPKMPLFVRIVELVGEQEAFRVFNMGCGMCLIVKKENVQAIIGLAKEFKPFVFGEIVNGKNNKNCRARFR